MTPLQIEDREEMICALQDEIRRNEDSRYDHRLHGVLLVAHGLSAREVATRLGDSARTVEYWVHRFNQDGFAGLAEKPRSGRPTKLTQAQAEKVQKDLRRSPQAFGLGQNLWDGKALQSHLSKGYGVELTARQCQRLFRAWGFRLRKPRPMIAQADASEQSRHKKTPEDVPRSSH
jgi:transposase